MAHRGCEMAWRAQQREGGTRGKEKNDDVARPALEDEGMGDEWFCSEVRERIMYNEDEFCLSMYLSNERKGMVQKCSVWAEYLNSERSCYDMGRCHYYCYYYFLPNIRDHVPPFFIGMSIYL